MKEEAMNLKKTGYGYMEGFGGEKWRNVITL